MPNINLIAQKRQEKVRMERLVRRLFFLMAGLFCAAILMFFGFSAQMFRVNAEIRDVEAELQKLEPTLDRIAEFKKKTDALGPKIQLYGKARDHTLRWYSYLQVVARSLPENTWLTRIQPQSTPSNARTTSGRPAPNAVVSLVGMTTSQQLVGETMLSLDRYRKLFDGVELKYTQQGQVGEVPTVEFEVATNIKDLPAIFQDQAPKPEQSKGEKDANQAKS